jgi:hypothetical protein
MLALDIAIGIGEWNREPPITLGLLEERRAKTQQHLAVARANEGSMIIIMRARPVVAQPRGITRRALGRSRQCVRARNDARFPCDISALHRTHQGITLDRDPNVGEIDKFFCRHRRHREAALGFGHDQSVRGETR